MAASKYYNTSLRNLAYRLRKYKDILNEYLFVVLTENDDIIEATIAEQLNSGINGKGEVIMDYMPYTLRTVQNKIKKGQPYNRVTLKDTGEFHNSFRVNIDKDGFYVFSVDKKANNLKEKYGGDTILRLTDENLKSILDNYIRPALAEKLKEYLQNGRT